MSGKISRRTFTRGTLAAAVAAGSSVRAAPGPSDKVRLGFIGVGNRGDQLLDAFLEQPDAQVVALCDVYEPYLPAARKKAGGQATLLHDYRKLLDMKDVDAVVVATPDHWHALMTIEACRAGKDVYCEKPLSLTIGEGRRMVQAAKEHKRVTQVGLHRRSAPFIREAVQAIREGAIGQVTVAKAYHLRNESPMGIGRPPDGPPPEGLDWEMWLGPAPKVPFNRNRALYKFRWFWDYSGGQLTNFGTHYLDVIQWALGQDAPRGVYCTGRRLAVQDNRQIPDTLEAVWEYDGTLVTFSQYNANASPGNPKGWEVEFRGTKGTLFLQEGGGYEIVAERVRTEELPALSPLERQKNTAQARATKPARESVPPQKGRADTAFHARNFLDAVKSRQAPSCPIEVGHRSTSATLLARMSLFRGRHLKWDAAKERTDDAEANRLLEYEYRAPWKLA